LDARFRVALRSSDETTFVRPRNGFCQRLPLLALKCSRQDDVVLEDHCGKLNRDSCGVLESLDTETKNRLLWIGFVPSNLARNS
jgi:hypothetical protein